MVITASDISLDRQYKTAYLGIKIFINYSLIREFISLKRVIMCTMHSFVFVFTLSLFRVSSFIIFEINGESALLRAS